MVKRQVLLIVAVLAATFAFGVSSAEATWGWGCGWGSCYTPCCTSCYSYCDPCCGSWYVGVRPGPIRRALFGPYRWYYAPTCYTSWCSPCIVTSACCDTVVDCCAPVTGACDAVAPMESTPIEATTPAPTPAPGAVEEPSTFLEPTAEDSGLLTVHVPYKAKVFINGNLTTTKGSTRRYVSFGLEPGLVYKYEIQSELERDGTVFEQTKTVYLRAGAREAVAFGYNVAPVTEVAAAR